MKTPKFSGCYRIPSARANGWNYDDNGMYYLTICTAHLRCILGQINESKMILSAIGKIVEEEWQKSFILRQEMKCEIYTIMPNHIHAIISLQNQKLIAENIPPTTNHGVAYRKPQSVSSFVSGFKSAVTSKLRQQQLSSDSIWHPRFYDHIVRDENDYQRIKEYILENPSRWQHDEYLRHQL